MRKITILANVKRSKLYKEENKFDFDIKHKKIIYNVDTYIYTVTLKNDIEFFDSWSFDFDKETIEWKTVLWELDYFLEENSEKILNEKVQFHDLYLTRGYRMYRLNFNFPDWFDISFNTKKLPNANTPRVLIRLSSSSLWLNGWSKTVQESYKHLKILLDVFGLGEIEEIKENRLDMAFHTNIIQNKEKYFSAERLAENYTGMLNKGSNIFTIDKENKEIDIETLALGSRKSNNVYFRVYDKTREVIEGGKKDYFLYLWLENNLISVYDFQILSRAYLRGSYNARWEIMAEYFLENSDDEKGKIEVANLLLELRTNNITINNFKKKITAYAPTTTTVLNFEFETHKKYYDTFKDIDKLCINTECKTIELLRIYKIYDNLAFFIKPLFFKQVVFDCPFWEKFQSLKMDKTCNIDMIRSYRKNILNEKRTCLDIVGKAAKLSTMLDKSVEGMFSHDISNSIDYIFNIADIDYLEYEHKAYKTRKRILSELSKK